MVRVQVKWTRALAARAVRARVGFCWMLQPLGIGSVEAGSGRLRVGLLWAGRTDPGGT